MLVFLKNLFYQVWDLIVVKVNPPLPGPPVVNPVNTKQALSNLMLQVNAPYVAYYPANSTIINAFIGTLTASAALNEAELIINNSSEQKLDYIYLAACIFQESKFYAGAYNHNMAEYNGKITFEGTDWGLCQMSGYYLPDRPGLANLTQAEMQVKALTAEWAVPTMAQIMHDNILQATTDLPSVSAIMNTLNSTDLTDVEFMATLYYNRGASGGLEAIKTLSYADMQHPFMVGRWFAQFKASLETGIHPASHIMVNHEPFSTHIKR
jgi:hypothetical protein